MAQARTSAQLPAQLASSGDRGGPSPDGLMPCRMVFGHGLWSMVDGLWSMVDGRWSMVDGRWSMVYGPWSMVYGP
jgi:hypothetical protein